MVEPLKLGFPTLGWQQVLTGRQKMLDDFDRARTQAKGHEIETYHGDVAEAAVREWLTAFLPKRYGVTSGYIISPGLDSEEKMPHYDVIVYDQLESPILWVETHGDLSGQGRVLAIPVEYVQCVLEVKSAMSEKTVKKAIEHLRDLAPLMNGTDLPGAAYRMYLPPTFCCGVFCFELRNEDDTRPQTLEAFLDGIDLRGYMGGLVLRVEWHTTGNTGNINLIVSDKPIEEIPADHTMIGEFGISKSVPVAQDAHVAVKTDWGESGFARFGFDLIARLQGTYRSSMLSSFYGMGSNVWELRKLMTPQKAAPRHEDLT